MGFNLEPRRIYNYHILIHNMWAVQILKRGIGKTRCKPMRNLAKIQMSQKHFRSPWHAACMPVGPSIATRSNHNIFLQYRLSCLYLSVSFIISISFCFCLLVLYFIGRIWTTLGLYNPQGLFHHNVKFEGSNGRVFKFWLLFWIYAN